MPEKSKRLRVMAGPNGSGKSNLINRIRLEYNCGPFVNADKIESLLRTNGVLYLAQYHGLVADDAAWGEFLDGAGSSWLQKAEQEGAALNVAYADNAFTLQNSPTPGLYDAALIADFVRYMLLQRGDTFTFETVLSDSRKLPFLEMAAEAGYKLYLYFICTVDPAINVQRVSQRVLEGGHDVPEPKIIDRYGRSLALLPALIPLMHRTYLFDNSFSNSETKLIAEIDKSGSLVVHEEQVPWWVEEHVIEPLFHE